MKNIKILYKLKIILVSISIIFVIIYDINCDENVSIIPHKGNIYSNDVIIAKYDLLNHEIKIMNRIINKKIINFIKNHNIRIINFSSNKFITDNEIQKLSEIDNIDFISELKNVKILYMENCNLKNKSLLSLRKLDKIYVLYLDSNKITDDGLKTLSELTRVEYLSIANNPISDKGIFYITQKKNNLFGINLNSTEITDKSVFYFSGCNKITDISLSNTKVSIEIIKYLILMSNLDRIYLDNLKIFNNDISDLKKLERLYYLDFLSLRNTDISRNKITELDEYLQNVVIYY